MNGFTMNSPQTCLVCDEHPISRGHCDSHLFSSLPNGMLGSLGTEATTAKAFVSTSTAKVHDMETIETKTDVVH